MPVRGERRRYLLFQIVSEGSLDGRAVEEAIRRGIMTLYGVKGLSQANPQLIEYDAEGKVGILRCSHSNLRQVRASLAYTTSLEGYSASIHVKDVSGTLRALRRRIRRQSLTRPTPSSTSISVP
jgi:RNase P/RNase MRP subunit POP5